MRFSIIIINNNIISIAGIIALGQVDSLKVLHFF